ncbi:sodium-dependent transporter [Kushneria aurantia]|uniref:Transporter n=1 Tax=Kushneria aurantia TaxID=504092 RepID=A0ABV6G1L5_9GAMM|nr:sodium-dependent transporter [Kushneria aurantia]
MSNKRHSHAQWSSRLIFILAAVGSAVGLGNIWKFPYMTGESGGGAFVLVYLVCIALIGLPILMSEWLLGRIGQKNPISTMDQIAGRLKRSRGWMAIGVAGIAGAWLILSFYSVIGGWALSYIRYAASGTFSGMNSDQVSTLFNDLLASPGVLLAWHSLFMVLVIAVVAAGVTSGLERAAKFLMPALAGLLLIMVGYAATTGSFGEGLAWLFQPDFSRITGEVVLAAMGHAFFTLSLGMGVMMAYGSYLGDDVHLGRTAVTVAVLDTVIALAAGMAIFPVVLANGLDPAAGPGLIFQSLPLAFGNMAGGLFFSVLFFVLLVFAAWTSAMSLLEPIVEWLEEKTPLSRLQAALAAGISAWLLGIAALLSFNAWSGVTIFGRDIFNTLDYLTANIMLPLTGLATIIFVGWVMGRDEVRAQLNLSGGSWKLWRFAARYIAPPAVAIVFIFGVLG